MKPLWMAGIVSVAQLARDFSCSRQAIRKHWTKAGIHRNLRNEIRSQASGLVQRAEAAGARLTESHELGELQRVPTDAETIVTNARSQAAVILGHRSDVRRVRELCGHLLTEMENASRLRAAEAGHAGKGRLPSKAGRSEHHSNSVSGRLDDLRKLAEIMRVLVDLERRVMGISDETAAESGEHQKQAFTSGLEELKARFKQRLAAV